MIGIAVVFFQEMYERKVDRTNLNTKQTWLLIGNGFSKRSHCIVQNFSMQSKSALFSHMHTFCWMGVTFWHLNGRAEFTRYETIDTFSALQRHPPGRMSTSFKIRCQPFGAHVRNNVTLKVWHHRTKHQSSPSLHKIVLCQLSCLLPYTSDVSAIICSHQSGSSP